MAMTEATAAEQLSITAQYGSKEHPVSVPPGTIVEKIWEEARHVLGIPDDVEIFDGVTPVRSDGFGLPWNHRLTMPVTLRFQDPTYDN